MEHSGYQCGFLNLCEPITTIMADPSSPPSELLTVSGLCRPMPAARVQGQARKGGTLPQKATVMTSRLAGTVPTQQCPVETGLEQVIISFQLSQPHARHLTADEMTSQTEYLMTPQNKQEKKVPERKKNESSLLSSPSLLLSLETIPGRHMLAHTKQ